MLLFCTGMLKSNRSKAERSRDLARKTSSHLLMLNVLSLMMSG